MKESWSKCKFDNVVDIVSGRNQKDVVSSKGKYPIYGSGGIIGRANNYLCRENTTIIGRKGNINSPMYVKEKFWNIDTAFGLESKTILESKLLFYFCLGFNFKQLDKSTAVPSLAKRDILNIEIPLPPLPEQRTIVAKIEQLFSELDHGIENLKTAQEQLKVYRQAVLKKAFEGGFSDKSYDLRKINSICEVVRGGSPRPAGSIKFYDGPIPFMKVKDISRNKGVYVDKAEYSIKEAGLKKTRQVSACTLLLTNSGATLGVPAITKIETTFNDGIAAFLGLEKDDLLYHYYYWESKTKYLRNINQGAAQPNLNTSVIGQMEIPIYEDKSEHNRIVQHIESRLSVCDKVEETIAENLQKAEALRQSILKKAFAGELLTEAEIAACKMEKDWEPAGELLKRIKNTKTR